MNSALHILATGRALPSRRVSNDQMASLVDSLFACTSPNYTPDGRIILATVKEEEIEKLFAAGRQ